MRYIEAETAEKDFIGKGLGHQFTLEIFIHFYFACHGCSDYRQKVLLNEKEIKKIFWESELKIKQLLDITGSNVKALVIYDCCREPYQLLKDKIAKALKKMKQKESQSPLNKKPTLKKSDFYISAKEQKFFQDLFR